MNKQWDTNGWAMVITLKVSGSLEESRKTAGNAFLVAVEKRDEQTLLPIIKEWIEPGTIIVSDCWKAYSKLETHGYEHRTVNHSREFVNL